MVEDFVRTENDTKMTSCDREKLPKCNLWVVVDNYAIVQDNGLLI